VVSQVLFHQLFGDLRSGLVERVTKETTLKPLSHVEKDDKGKEKTVVDEKDAIFVNRAVAEGAVTKEQLRTWLQEMCDDGEYAFGEYLKSERRHAAPKKLSKEIEQLVAAAIADGTASARAAKLSKLLGRVVDSNDPLSLGNAIRDHRKQAMEAALAAAKAELE
jgi:Glu-tRNA(Gln) amidotransferase subunit E-like FAD-binding protein